MKSWKMKLAGYICIVFALVVSILILSNKVDKDLAWSISQYWGGFGITLLFGNAGKTIIGKSQMAKQEK
jgi:hypothetical protein